MSRATSIAIDSHLDLLGPPIEEQCAYDIARMESHGVALDQPFPEWKQPQQKPKAAGFLFPLFQTPKKPPRPVKVKRTV
jgi:hypothetical protein